MSDVPRNNLNGRRKMASRERERPESGPELAPEFTGRSRSRLALALLLLATTGCVSTSNSFSLPWLGPAEEPPCKVIGFWDREVKAVMDTKNGGREEPVLRGRVYFYGLDANGQWCPHPQPAQGTLVVDWYDVSKPSSAPPLLGKCVYDPQTLQKFLRKDIVGMGYTIVAPWPGYRPEHCRVKIHVYLVGAKGDPLYAEPVVVSLNGDAPLMGSELSVPITVATDVPTGTQKETIRYGPVAGRQSGATMPPTGDAAHR
jgi:hypothetical protein